MREAKNGGAAWSSSKRIDSGDHRRKLKRLRHGWALPPAACHDAFILPIDAPWGKFLIDFDVDVAKPVVATSLRWGDDLGPLQKHVD
jgi:hypothetical protein